MSGNTIDYYICGNTAKGFYNLVESNLQPLESIYLLKGASSTVKSTIIKRLAEDWRFKGYSIEQIHSPTDNNSLDGLIIPALQFGIFNATVVNPSSIEAIARYVNLDTAFNHTKLEEKRNDIAKLQTEINTLLQSAYDFFREGLRLHDYLEDIYITEMSFQNANEITDDLIHTILFDKSTKQGSAIVRHRFFGASTPVGVVDFIPSITKALTKRYFIKGRAGTGKSTLLKKIIKAAEDKNFDMEVYHCGFDPTSIDMVVIRELGVCIFDSTDPHEYFTERSSDEIVDLYEKTVTPGTDEKYESAITYYTKSYKQRMKDGIRYLESAKAINDRLEKIYTDAVDFGLIDDLYSAICNEISEMEVK